MSNPSCLMQTDGRTSTHEEANNPFSLLCETAFKVIVLQWKWSIFINLSYDEGILICTRFIHIFVLPKLSASSELTVYVFWKGKLYCATGEQTARPNVLPCFAMQIFPNRICFFLWMFICMLLPNCQNPITTSKASYVGNV